MSPRCDWCDNVGHFVDQCPHLAAQLLSPDPKANGVRAFFKVIDDALAQAGQDGIGAAAIINNTPSDTTL